MPKKILYFQQSFPNLTETFVKAEIRELLLRDYDLEVLCLTCNRDELVKIEFATRVFETAPSNLAQEIKKRTPDYIHVPWSTEAWRIIRPIAEQLEIPFGCSVHAADIWRRGNRLEPEELQALGAHPLCITIAVEGSFHREYLLWCKVPAEKLIITPNSVSLSGLPQPRETPPNRLQSIVSIGRAVPKKGFYTGIDAIRFMRMHGYDVRYHIIGGGEQSTEEGRALVAYAEQFPFITVSGMIAHSQALLQLRDADALLVPSIVAENGDSDGIPTVITEAMLLGVPVVATDVGSISDLVIDGETAFLARAADAASVAAKLVLLENSLQDPEKRQLLLQRAKRKAQRHETTASVNVLAEHLERRLGRFSR